MPQRESGGTKNIVSYSLYGQAPLYTQGALENLSEMDAIYPGWISRFYIEEDSIVLREVQASADEVIVIPRTHSVPGKFWRHYAVSDPQAGYVIIRDCDSRITTRDKAAVDEWIALGQHAHLMHEVPAHKDFIMAGMWGIRGGIIRNMEQLIRDWLLRNYYHAWSDQNFLREVVWPLIKSSVLCHGIPSDAGPSIPFPKHPPMKCGEYVGQKINSWKSRP